MPIRLGLPEILILLIIVLILFGPGRIGKIAGELGQGIKNFREGLSGKNEGENKPEPPQQENKE
ncbi:MAG: Sec-independent protein translocase TatA [Anaerolineae bacterium UTCFX3]|jgi:sec-independent protein translocase protein TatA|nr:MAG: Sec-independent protein translocase TatA [Anaerolineae bacterium UTCFX3]